ncbi:MAG: toll/interleukin-1 receptor domain-containing protein [Comamonadaceae bacterium]|nr:toll/interleukin-1 receptor domain-containing protein [Comamonadaceae bacterium]
MRAIFISYRREDAEGQAGRLFDDLVIHFGEDAVFMDVAGIEPGRDFRRAIDEQVASCGVLLAVIGKNWCDAQDESGRRRLDDPMDFVRLETASALKRDIPVIPVLVRGQACRGRSNYPRTWRTLPIATQSS